MKIKYKSVLILLLSSSLYMCNTPHSKNESAGFEIETKRMLNVQSIKYGDTKYFKSSKIIKLETTDENLIGEIAQVEFCENRFYVLDKRLSISNLLVFDLNGKFLSKIGTIGEGPDEYLNISSFFVDDKAGIINIIDGLTSTVVQYDKEGNFRGKIRHNNPHLNFTEKALPIENLLFCYSKTNWEGNYMYFIADKNDFSLLKVIRTYPGKYTEHYMINFCVNPFTYIDGEVHFGALFTDTIFSLRNDSIAPYTIIKSKKNIDIHEMLKELEKDNYDYGMTFDRIAKENRYNTGTANYFENSRYIMRDFFGVEYFLDATLWDKKEKKGVYISGYTPCSGPDLFPFISSFGNTVIQVWNNMTIQMFINEMDAGRIKASDYPPEVIDLVRKHNTEEDNPLLILHEFKDDL